MLSEKGVEVHFITLRSPGPLSEALCSRNVQVGSLNANRSIVYWSAAVQLASKIRQGHYDVVHACESIPASIAAITRYLAPGPKFIFHRHHNANPQKTRVYHELANRLSDRLMTCSAFTKDHAIRVDGIPKDRIKVAYNGIIPLRDVQPAEIREIRGKLGIPPNAKVISIVARLSEEKGHLTLIKAAEITARSIPEPVHLVITGDGHFESEIRKSAEKAVNITVHFTGRQDDVAPWFAVGDVIAMPSYTEAFGLSAVEAMSSGRPLVASGVGGLLEVVEDRVSGLLVPPKDPGALSEAIFRLLNSNDLSRSLAEGGRKRVTERFTLEKMVDGWIDCYNWALAEG